MDNEQCSEVEDETLVSVETPQEWIVGSLQKQTQFSYKAIQESLSQAELDGFIAYHLLTEPLRKDFQTNFQNSISNLNSQNNLSRSDLAKVGIAFFYGWLETTQDWIDCFIRGFRRLLNQNLEEQTGIGFHNSLRLLLGVSLGVTVLSNSNAWLKTRMQEILAVHLSNNKTKSLNFIMASYLLSITNTGHKTENREIPNNLIYYLLTRQGTIEVELITPGLWALGRNCFNTSEINIQENKLQNFENELRGYLYLVSTENYDIIEHCMFIEVTSILIKRLTNPIFIEKAGIDINLRVFNTFNEIVRHLRDRKHKRPPFVVENEYDVQDLLYVMLKPFIADLTPEDWTPKDSGGAKRIDFISVEHNLVIEAKCIRDTSHANDVGNDLKIDIESYYVHKACDTLLCFVYDPKKLIPDSNQLERDLSGPRTIKGRRLSVIVKVRS